MIKADNENLEKISREVDDSKNKLKEIQEEIAKNQKINNELKEKIGKNEPFFSDSENPKNLRNIPEFAGGHHEKLDGTGYPKEKNYRRPCRLCVS